MASVHSSEDEFPDFRTYLRSTYESLLAGVDPKAAKTLAFGAARLAATVRKAVDRKVGTGAPGEAAERWLVSQIGPLDDPLRRAAVASLALGLKPDAEILPASILTLYPAMHARLARFLTGSRMYDKGLFAGDIALAAGAHAPLGPLTIALPTPEAPHVSLPRLKRAGAMARRHWADCGHGAATSWLAEWRALPWVELHVDIRNLEEFNAAGFVRGYHRLADLLAIRPDLVGVYGASWLYQPELSQISPSLAFVRETAEAGGGRVVRLRADPVQTAFAIARSPTRKRLYLSGGYKPICYGMFWERQALLDWSISTRRAEAEPSPAPRLSASAIGGDRRL